MSMGLKAAPFKIIATTTPTCEVPTIEAETHKFLTYKEFCKWKEARATQFQHALKCEWPLPLTSQLGLERLWELDKLAREHFKEKK